MIPTKCQRCGRAIWVWPWQARLCRTSQFETCVGIARAIAIDEGCEPEPGDPWVDLPPLDAGVCSACRGTGIIYRNDWEMGPQPEDCGRCEGSKMDPTWV